jgi:hypothetical protein
MWFLRSIFGPSTFSLNFSSTNIWHFYIHAHAREHTCVI